MDLDVLVLAVVRVMVDRRIVQTPTLWAFTCCKRIKEAMQKTTEP